MKEIDIRKHQEATANLIIMSGDLARLLYAQYLEFCKVGFEKPEALFLTTEFMKAAVLGSNK